MNITLPELLYKGIIGIICEKGMLHHSFYFIAIALMCVMSYFLGSLNFAVIISKIKFKDDIRNHGSGNAGSTNMSRVYGKGAGIATLLGDILKAVVAVLIARLMVGEVYAYLAGLFCAVGHAFPCYYKFKGGKCVAVTAAIALTLQPAVFLIMLVMFAVIVLTTKYVSLGSIFSALMYPMILYNITKIQYGHSDIRVVFVLIICVLLIYLHKENIKRLYEGKENKLNLKKEKKSE